MTSWAAIACPLVTCPAGPRSSTVSRIAGRLAAALAALQVLVLVGFALFYLVGLSRGAAQDTGRAVVSVILILLLAVGLGLVARGLWGADRWSRTPMLLWNVLLLPVGWGLLQSGQTGVGAVVLVVAVAGIVTPLADRRPAGPDPAEPDPAEPGPRAG